jgi:hypothetical protein
MQVLLSLFFLVIVAAVWVWDVYVIIQAKPGLTVSATMHRWSVAWPILPFLVGVLVGHVFWPASSNNP